MILQSDNIMKRYKSKIVLNDINFSLNEGEVCAIFGKNGAGKSTFIKIALGLIFQNEGNILYLLSNISSCFISASG